eukprot:6782986-Pyramimonas_sp.AAC.1
MKVIQLMRALLLLFLCVSWRGTPPCVDFGLTGHGGQNVHQSCRWSRKYRSDIGSSPCCNCLGKLRILMMFLLTGEPDDDPRAPLSAKQAATLRALVTGGLWSPVRLQKYGYRDDAACYRCGASECT